MLTYFVRSRVCIAYVCRLLRLTNNILDQFSIELSTVTFFIHYVSEIIVRTFADFSQRKLPIVGKNG